MTQIKHNLKFERRGESSGKGWKVNGYSASITTEATEREGQKGLPVIVSAIKGSNGGKP